MRRDPKLVLVPFFALFALFAYAPAAHAAITLDATSSLNCDVEPLGCAGPTFTYPASVSSSADFLVVGVETEDGPPTPAITSVTYNGVPMTLGTTTLTSNWSDYGPYNGDTREDIWYMATSGVSSNVVINYRNDEPFVASVAASFDGVNTSDPIRGYAEDDDASNFASVNVPSAQGDLVFDIVCNGTSVYDSYQTTLWIANIDGDYTCDNTGASIQTALSNVTTMNWDVGSDLWMDLAVSLEPTTGSYSCASIGGGARRCIITSGPSFTVPSDWNSASNTIETIGGGGSGAAVVNDNASGGGGGAYNFKTNVALTPGANETVTVGFGGDPVSVGASGGVGGNDGGDTCFGGSALPSCIVGSQGGSGGNVFDTIAAAAAGGLVSSGVGSGFDGGSSGAASAGGSATGGGGAAGPNGAGASSSDADRGDATAGGQGDNGFGGAGGNSSGSNGSPGSEWGSAGSGGGGGSIKGGGAGTAGSGGNYGAGGGGIDEGCCSTSGAGAPGVIVITYTPVEATISRSAMFEFWGGFFRMVGGSLHIQ